MLARTGGLLCSHHGQGLEACVVLARLMCSDGRTLELAWEGTIFGDGRGLQHVRAVFGAALCMRCCALSCTTSVVLLNNATTNIKGPIKH